MSEPGTLPLWVTHAHRLLWSAAATTRVALFLSGSRLEKFSAATQIPVPVAQGIALSFALTSVAMTIEGFLRPPGRFLGVGVGFATIGLGADWTNAEHVSASIAMLVVGIAAEVLMFWLLARERAKRSEAAAGAFDE